MAGTDDGTGHFLIYLLLPPFPHPPHYPKLTQVIEIIALVATRNHVTITRTHEGNLEKCVGGEA